MITRISFPAVWSGQIRPTQAEFKLGPGPCGKTVTHLRQGVVETCFMVRQEHDDGTAKEFTYQLRDITGRIEVEHSA